MKTIGIDLGIRKVAWSAWQDERLVLTKAVDYSDMAGSRGKILFELATDVLADATMFCPDSVWIEDNLIGNNKKYSIALAQTMGAVSSHLWRFSQYAVNVSTWKKEVVGSGSATKPMIKNYMDVVHKPYSVLCGDDQDRYDAACIGYYGQLIELQAARRTSS